MLNSTLKVLEFSQLSREDVWTSSKTLYGRPLEPWHSYIGTKARLPSLPRAGRRAGTMLPPASSNQATGRRRGWDRWNEGRSPGPTALYVTPGHWGRCRAVTPRAHACVCTLRSVGGAQARAQAQHDARAGEYYAV